MPLNMMRSVKCQAALKVVDALGRAKVDVLYLEGFALDGGRLWGTQFSDDLQVLVRHEDMDGLMKAMDDAGYLPAMYDPQAGRCRALSRAQAKAAVLKMPVSPEPFYVHWRWAGELGEPDLLIRFHTTKRHGRLMLADLEEWFDPTQREQFTAMESTPQQIPVPVSRPPLWAMLLWQAGEAMNHASDCAIAKDEIDKLYRVAQQQTGLTWSTALSKAQQYSADYDRRIKSPEAAQLLNDYGRSLGICQSDLTKAEREYGALYEFGHALRALRDYEDYRDCVDEKVWAQVEPVTREQRAKSVTCERPRKLWGYPGGQEDVPGPNVRGRLGLADAAFGIHEQIEEHPGADFDHLVRHDLVTPLISNAPPHGPWAHCTECQLDAIFAA